MGRADELIAELGLEPHPEGGFFREIHRSKVEVEVGPEEGGERRRRCGLTVIHFLLRRGDVSRWHVVASDEAWHFAEGDPLELVTWDPHAESLGRSILAARVGGPELEPEPGPEGALPVHVVPAGFWQAARPLGEYALVGCTVGPGFDFADFRLVADLEDHPSAFRGPLSAHADLL